jgi:uncharacterized protein (TIGR02300 family)
VGQVLRADIGPRHPSPVLGSAIDRGFASRQGKHRFRPQDATQGCQTVAKPELGTKRLCANCGAKFYDLSKDPIVCPKCNTLFVPPVAARARTEVASAPTSPEEEVAAPEVAEAEFVSLEDADKESEGAKGAVAEGAEEDVEVDDESLDDAAFIVPEEDEEDDVTDIIGDGLEDDEET